VRKRRKKLTYSKRNYVCNFCKKSYFSHPALYTHKRNKHNIFPMNFQTEDFKYLLISTPTNGSIKFSDYDTFTNFHKLIKVISENWEILINGLYLNSQCILYNDKYNIPTNTFSILMKNIHQNKVFEILKAQSTKPTIDQVLLVYLITFHNITNSLDLLRIIIKFCILLREYLNNFGWDDFRSYEEYGIDMGFDTTQLYTNCMDCKYIPDQLNNFLSVFMELDPLFYIEKDILLKICENFSNWLYVNNFSNFKIYYRQE
jgi:hypothetical protein